MNKIIHSPLCISYFSGCKVYGFVSTVAALAEIWSLAAVSCDRLQAILYPLDKHKRITKLQVFYEYTFVYDVKIYEIYDIKIIQCYLYNS